MSEGSDKQKSQTNEEQSQNDQNGTNGVSHKPQFNASAQYKQMYDIISRSSFTELESFVNTLEQNKQLMPLLNEREANYKQTIVYHMASSRNFEFALQSIELVHSKGAQIIVNDFLGQSPFFYATRIGNLNLIKYFIQQNADINETDNYKQTPLFYIAREGNVEAAQIFADQQVNINHKDLIHQTPLFYAAREGKLLMCDFLLKNGANVNEVDLKKQTALYYAKKFKKQEIIDFLVKNGAFNTKDGRITKTDKSKMKKSCKDEKSQYMSKKKKHKYKETQKFSYKLCRSSSIQDSVPLDKKHFQKFKEKYPFIAKILLDQEIALNSEEIMTKLREDNWKSVASKIIQALWKTKNTGVFHDPVDPEKLGIPTYFDIVKKPMDFSTVKKKIQLNIYQNCNGFLDDMNQIFINCKLFNGVDTYVGKIGVDTKKKFEELLQQYQFNERYQGQHFDFEEFLKHVFDKMQREKEEQKTAQQNSKQIKEMNIANQNLIIQKINYNLQMLGQTLSIDDVTYGSKKDIKLSVLDYYDMVQPLRQQNFDTLTMLKWRNLFMVNATLGSITIFGSIIPSYFLSKFIIGPFLHGPVVQRMLIPSVTVFSYFFMQLFGQKQVHRRLYTELLTDETENGTYLRETLREKTPALWSNISRQLYELDYKFPEMFEYAEKEIPSSLLSQFNFQKINKHEYIKQYRN